MVSHLRGIATEFPPFASAGAAVAQGKPGEQVVAEAARATSLELRDLGFTWVFAPVADVTIGAADPTIGSRSPSGDPTLASRAVAAAVEGYDDAGLVSTTKHFPGHGSVTADSHETLPVLGSSLAELRDPRPAAVRGRRRRGRAGGDDGPPRRAVDPAGDAVEPGAEGLRLPARRPRVRGAGHHRLARHGRGAEPRLPGDPGARGRRRPAADAGRHREDPPAGRRRDRERPGQPRAGRGGRRPGWSRCSCGSSGSPATYRSPRTPRPGPSRRRPTWRPRAPDAHISRRIGITHQALRGIGQSHGGAPRSCCSPTDGLIDGHALGCAAHRRRQRREHLVPGSSYRKPQAPRRTMRCEGERPWSTTSPTQPGTSCPAAHFLRIGALGATGAGLMSARGLAGPYLSSHGCCQPTAPSRPRPARWETSCSTSRCSRPAR